MIKKSIYFAVFSTIVFSSSVNAAGFLGVGDNICGPICSWKTSFFSVRETYKARENLGIVDDLTSCEDSYSALTKEEDAFADKTGVTKLPKGSIYQVQPKNGISSSEQIVDVYTVTDDASKKLIKGGLYKLCLNNPVNGSHRIKRVGGMKTGLLVVPFKFRNGDHFSADTTIGPYWGYGSDAFTWLVTAGAAQVSVGTGVENEVQTKQGFTFATGAVYSINESFDIAFVVGQDRVFGSDIATFEHNGNWWRSIAIGYNFTTSKE